MGEGEIRLCPRAERAPEAAAPPPWAFDEPFGPIWNARVGPDPLNNLGRPDVPPATPMS